MDFKDGGTTSSYSWGQTQAEVNVYVTVPKYTNAKEIFVRINPNTLTIKHTINGEETTLVEGGFEKPVCVDECTWMLEGKQRDTIHVYLEKADSDFMWSSVIQGDVDTDTGKNLLSAAREGRASDLLRLIRDREADVNFHDSESGFTALHWAAACGQLDVLNVLVDLAGNVDLNAQDKSGNTPLLIAIQNLQTKAALALLEFGADVHTVNQAGGSGLMIAAGTGEVTLVKALIRRGASVNAQDNAGFTAAMHASKLGSPASIVMLIQEGNIDLGLKSYEGKTALEYALDQPTVDTLCENSIFLQAHGRQYI
eukprot:CAMPEP_0196576594 /NCGR_PEP_ID=MMETSP1081-20130531/5812_1 /TAXON_ID=36882 /ORGANISM="Pyramimonas amylifera, Strain CCMP720" /LENGTH=310 /DNA_ID=CAMNT_0041895241 /DNA_START=116 /DNA_END=1048 /DNA_ORIENTATION=-